MWHIGQHTLVYARGGFGHRVGCQLLPPGSKSRPGSPSGGLSLQAVTGGGEPPLIVRCGHPAMTLTATPDIRRLTLAGATQDGTGVVDALTHHLGCDRPLQRGNPSARGRVVSAALGLAGGGGVLLGVVGGVLAGAALGGGLSGAASSTLCAAAAHEVTVARSGRRGR